MEGKPNADRVTGQLVTVAFGNEASRRVAWAKYYEAKEQIERLLRLNTLLEERLAELVVMIAVNESFVEPTINAIIKGGRTGATGEIVDGKIFVLGIEHAVRIRTGETDAAAL